MSARRLQAVLVAVWIFIGAITLVAVSQTMVINEVAWAGTQANAADEWIELYNPSAESVDLTGWVLTFNEVVIHLGAVEGATKAVRRTAVEPGGFFLLERSDDNTILDIEADLIYTGALPNTGCVIRLFDSNGLELDTANAGLEKGWAAGNLKTGEPACAAMERVDPTGIDAVDNWRSNNGQICCGHDANGAAIHGTPGAKNSATIVAETVPVVQVLTPANAGEEASGRFIIRWAASDPNGADDQLRIGLYLSRDSGETWEVVIEGLANGGSYGWDTTSVPDGKTYQLKVIATNSAGLSGEALSPIFAVVNEP